MFLPLGGAEGYFLRFVEAGVAKIGASIARPPLQDTLRCPIKSSVLRFPRFYRSLRTLRLPLTPPLAAGKLVAPVGRLS